MKKERINLLQEFIESEQEITMQKLLHHFNYSESTLRRYLDILEKQGLIEKHYGGVRAVINTIPYDKRFERNIQSKHKIGLLAASLIKDNDSIFIDSGTTTIHIIDSLKNVKNITIITNNMNVIYLCKNFKNYKLIFLGGEFINSTNCCANYDTVKILKKYNLNKSFIAANGFSLQKGATNSDICEHDIKSLAVKQCQQSILVIDHSKFGRAGLATFAPANAFHTIITDQMPDPSYIQYCTNNHIDLIWPNIQENKII